MYQIDMMSRVPIYEQIVEQTKKFILTGVLSPGDRLPTVRKLSADLSLNPNTVAKSFREMERLGLTCAATGKGSFISEQALTVVRQEKQAQLGDFALDVHEMLLGGVKKEELLSIIEDVYGGACQEAQTDENKTGQN